MKHIKITLIALLLGITSTFDSAAQDTNQTNAIDLAGVVGASSRWRAGWLDLDKPVDFQSGDKLRLHVGGSANRILVRLLPQDQFPDSPVGIVGTAIAVPKDRIVEITLPRPHLNIMQISVHGGHTAWHYILGAHNGPAILEFVELIRP